LIEDRYGRLLALVTIQGRNRTMQADDIDTMLVAGADSPRARRFLIALWWAVLALPAAAWRQEVNPP
jgi:hypothetical protein